MALKWSDGQPFTTNDIMFWFEDIYQNKDLVPIPTYEFTINGKPGTIEKIDDLTVAFKFPDPYFLFEEIIAGNTALGNGHALGGQTLMGSIAPAHYLKQFHPKYVTPEELDRLAKEAKFDNWVNLFKFKNDWSLNVELPVLTPWKATSPVNTTAWTLERNPYYWSVDPEGNQLPYIDKIQMTLAENLEVLNLRAIAGEYDIQGRHEMIQMLPVYLENAQKSNFTMRLDPGDYGAEVQLYVNQSFDADPEIAKWTTNRDFRRALSMGIDREQLNETFWLGTGTPGSPVVDESHPHFPGPEWRTKWSTLDRKQANELLDKIGLDKKDAEGYRLRTDGSGRLRIVMTTIQAAWMDQTAVCEMIAQHWRQIGIAGRGEGARAEPDGAADPEQRADDLGPRCQYGRLAADRADRRHPGQPDVRAGTRVRQVVLLERSVREASRRTRRSSKCSSCTARWRACRASSATRERKEIWRIAVDEQWGIGTVGLAAANLGVRLVRNNMGNVPERLSQVRAARHPGATHPSTYFFKTSEPCLPGPA